MTITYAALLSTIGAVITASSSGMMLYHSRGIKWKIRQYVPKVIVKDKKRPKVTHIISKEYGYRIHVELPKNITNQQFIVRKEKLEDYLGYKVHIEPREDLLVTDVILIPENYIKEI